MQKMAITFIRSKTMASDLTWRIRKNFLVSSKDCTGWKSSKEPVLAWRSSNALFTGMVDESGQTQRSTRALLSILVFQGRGNSMTNLPLMNEVEVLLVEDNPNDAELTMRALKKRNLANRLFHAKDGAEALDFVFAKGPFETRR